MDKVRFRKLYFFLGGVAFFFVLCVLFIGSLVVDGFLQFFLYLAVFLFFFYLGIFFIDRGRGRPYQESLSFIVAHLRSIPFSRPATTFYVILATALIMSAILFFKRSSL